jgi:3-deoxy-D-manno-octulosonic-acid transferase
VIVAGSTVEDEDELILAAFQRVRTAMPECLLILAPRHPERFAKVAELAAHAGAVKATDLKRDLDHVGVPTLLPADAQVIVLDTIGDLAALYALASVALVGGSFVSHGGHNPLEPAQFGVPVVMGTSFENFREVVNTMKGAEAIRIVGEVTPAETSGQAEAKRPYDLRDELASAVLNLLQHPEDARKLGERGREVFEREGGATARTVEQLCRLINARAPSHSDPVPA